MYITCLDVEGVLVPEIWIAFAEESGIPELKRTTRDEPDYNKLMRWRLDIFKKNMDFGNQRENSQGEKTGILANEIEYPTHPPGSKKNS